MCGHRGADCGGWRALKRGPPVAINCIGQCLGGGGVVLWWYIDRSLLGTAEKTQTPTLPPPACSAFYNPLYSGQQAEIDTGEKAHRGTCVAVQGV